MSSHGVLSVLKIYQRFICPNVTRIFIRTVSIDSLSCHRPPSLIEGPGITQFRFLHLSSLYHGKRLPSGVQTKRDPLKFKKKKGKEKVEVYPSMTIASLAAAMNRSIDHVFEILDYIPGTAECNRDNSELDIDVTIQVVKKCGMAPKFTSKKIEVKEDKNIVREGPPDPSVMVKRPPVVAIMGHVDHGKTTLLDRLRDSRIVDGEFGGITQHIGAFIVHLENGESVCFLDTPGHAAFSAMRSRGAHMTDLVVLVVAADDGVMQQTIESIGFAQDAGVPVIVAINKIDKNNSDIERTKTMLLEHEIQLEEFGGDVQAVPISALKSSNIDGLLEALVTQAEMMDLKGDPTGKVEGKVVESKMDPKKGRVATMIIQRGTLKKGDVLVAGLQWAKVKAMHDDQGQAMKEATPGIPVEVMGWKGLPNAGEEVLQADSESHANTVLRWRQSIDFEKKQEEDAAMIELQRKEHYDQYKAVRDARLELGHRYSRQKGKKPKETVSLHDGPSFSMLLKGDVDGSIEAINDTLETYNSKKCRLDILRSGVGHVTESDVELAASFDGKIFAFNVDVPQQVFTLAKSKDVAIASHNIIYRLFEDIKDELTQRLPFIHEDTDLGEAKVLQVFQVTMNKKKTYVAGCRCTSGMMSKKHGVKVLRNDEEVFKGTITSLKHFKEERATIKQEMECGISLSDPDFVFMPQDTIVCYDVKEVSQEIDWDPGF